jgi:hypothetical protein
MSIVEDNLIIPSKIEDAEIEIDFNGIRNAFENLILINDINRMGEKNEV